MPESFEVVAELVAHVVGDVNVDRVHALHGMAAAVHLGDFGNAGVVEPGGVGVPVVVRLEVAEQVGPGAVGDVGGLDFLVALADGDAGPRFGLDVDGPAGAVALGVESFGGGGDVVVGVVGAARVAAFGAEEQVVRGCRVVAFAAGPAVGAGADAAGLPVVDGPSHERGEEGRQVEGAVGAVFRGCLGDGAAEFAELPVELVGGDACGWELERCAFAVPAFDGHEFAPADAGPGGEDVHDEVVVPAGEQGAAFGEADRLDGRDHVGCGLLGGGGGPALGPAFSSASLASFGGVVVDLLGVDGVAEDGDQQVAGAAGDGRREGGAAGADPGRDGFLPFLDFL